MASFKVVAGDKFGLNWTDISDILAKYGPAVLQLVIKALGSGLSLSVVLELLKLFGPSALKSVVAHTAAQNKVVNGHHNDNSCCVYTCSYEHCPLKNDDAHANPCDGCDCVDGNEGHPSKAKVANASFVDLALQVVVTLVKQYGPAVLDWLVKLLEEAKTDPDFKTKLVAVVDESLASN